MKCRKILLTAVLPVVLPGCVMLTSTHRQLMAAEEYRLNDLRHQLQQVSSERDQLKLDQQSSAGQLQECRSALSVCDRERAALQAQLEQCNARPTAPVTVAECNITNVRFEMLEDNKPPQWLRDFHVPDIRIKPQKDGVNAQGETLYYLSAAQLDELNSGIKLLIRASRGWPIWYREVLERPQRQMPAAE
ncbi:MAG: hypothetical protein LRY66_00270 [Saccharospirillaceae bacterium]|nr:hypothetical protein [Saccharospirillaceae bacterium]MCD8529814.1 hypothetical protein [Saccharospirillaceae bacterium]